MIESWRWRMEKYCKKGLVKLFWKLQKGEGLYWFLEILAVTIIGMAIYLFLFYLWLYKIFTGNLQDGTGELGSILGFSQKALHILIVGCVFVGVFTLQSLCYFRSIKNQRRSAVLRALGFWSRWRNSFDRIEAFLAVVISFLPSFMGAKYLFLLTAREIIGTEPMPVMQEFGLFIRIFFVSFFIVILLTTSYRMAEFSEVQKSIGEQLRGMEHKIEKQEKNRFYYFFIGIYFMILLMIAEQIKTVFIGTVILFLLGLCNNIVGKIGIRITEMLVKKYRKKKGCYADFFHIALKTGETKGKKNVFLITVMATGLFLFYFLSSIDWGLENFLERFWIQSRHHNIYLEAIYGQEGKIEEWLSEQGFSYQKLYVKDWEEEGLTLAVSECKDTNSPYYIQEGYIRTIPYNLYRWNVSGGNRYQLSGKEFWIEKPVKEEGFQLISYTCLISYNDWKEQLDETYAVAFAMYADKKMLATLIRWTEENGIEMMTASRYIDMIKQIYVPYLKMLEVIFLILSSSILLFLFVSILSSIIAREKEFFVYRGCGIGWKRIRNLVLMQYLYHAFLGSLVSAFLYSIIFNGFKMVWFGNTTIYFVGIRQIIMITVLVFIFIGIECLIIMGLIQKRNKNMVLQLRAE